MNLNSEDENEVMLQRTEVPHDLIFHNILTRLPIKPVIRFKSVSKQWYSTICSSQFRQAHLKFPRSSSTESLFIRSNNQFHYFTYEDGDHDAEIPSTFEMSLVDEVDFDVGDQRLELVGSCNGLVCLGSTSGSLFIIWNPITCEFSKFPADFKVSEFSAKKFEFTWGFGYVSAVDDYKVVRICKELNDPSISMIHLFSMRANKWRRINDDSSHRFSTNSKSWVARRFHRPGVLINETIDDGMSGASPMLLWMESKVLMFDLSLDLFTTFPHFNEIRPSTRKDASADEFLFVVKGYLSKYGIVIRSNDGVVTILRHTGVTEKILVSKDLLGRACWNLTGFEGSDKCFTYYYSDGRATFRDPRPMFAARGAHTFDVPCNRVKNRDYCLFSKSCFASCYSQGRPSRFGQVIVH